MPSDRKLKSSCSDVRGWARAYLKGCKRACWSEEWARDRLPDFVDEKEVSWVIKIVEDESLDFHQCFEQEVLEAQQNFGLDTI